MSTDALSPNRPVPTPGIPGRLFGRRGLLTSSTRSGRRAGNVLILLFLVPVGYLVLTPLIRLQQLALEDGARGYDAAADVRNLGKVLLTTVGLAVGSLVIALVLGTALAWFSSRLPRRWQWMGVLPILPIVMPAVAFVTGWAFLLSPRAGYINHVLRRLPWWSDLRSGPVDVYTPTWIIILTGFGLTSFIYVFMRAGMRRLSYELTEAAFVSGATSRRAFFTVVLPLLRPSFVYGGSIALLLGLGQFTGPLLLGQAHNVRVLTTEIYRFTSESPIDHGVAAALASPLLVVGLVVVLVQRMLLSNQDRFVTDVGKGSGTEVRTSRTAPVWLGLYGLLAVVLPFLAIVFVSLSKYWRGSLDFSGMSLDNFRVIRDTPVAMQSIRTSLVAATGGVLISLPVGYLAAEIIYRKRGGRVTRTVTDFLVNLPLGIPGVVFGAGFLFTYTREPFVLYGKTIVIILVYVTLMLPFTTRMQLAARYGLGDSFEAAARVSGAGAIRTHLTIVIPMIRGSLSGAAALMFVLLSHEFAASLLVKSTRTHLMGTALYDFWVSSSYTVTAAMAVVMCIVTTIGVGVAVRFGGGTQTLDKL
ncbi:ABC transporter permease [Desertimonas flava]|jgi:iron(III) transport system permease protein|uniref:ABC transporter permease n=1 Tax=Desertimonas flava TaxID=2064846 RepID=UPI000E343E36|nr:iron ABC transporter permease [Desertimonas flava]